MKSNRLFQMIYLLMNHKQMAAPALAEHLGVSVRTIYRYVDDLSSAGIPIYVLQGRHGGIALLPEYKIDKTIVNKQEQTSILAALNGLQNLGVENNATIEKLSALFRQQPVTWIAIDPSTWTDVNSQKSTLAQLRDAILQSRLVTFDYLSAKNESTRRKVFPYQVVFKDKAWYLSGYAVERQAERLFKLSRINHLQVTQDSTLPGGEQPWLADSNERQATAPTQIAIQLQAAADLKYRLFESFPSNQITQQANGDYQINTQMNDDAWLIGYLLSFGSHLKVIQPTSLRHRIKNEVQKILQQY